MSGGALGLAAAAMRHEARVRARARALPAAFLEEIARPDLEAKTTYAAVAGLIVLRAVDRWLSGGCRPMDVSGARAAVAEMDTGNPARGVLARVLAELESTEPGASERAVGGLVTYGQILERDARWAQAIAVYDAVIEHGDVTGAAEHVFLALIRKALSLRTTGPMAEAVATTRKAQALAATAGNSAWHIQAQISSAMHYMVQGHLSQADELIRDAYDTAPPDCPDFLRARLLNGLGAIAGLGGDYEAAIGLCYDALEHEPEPSERDRILHNIGEGFRNLGFAAAARDAFLILSCAAEEQFTRSAALISLMLLASQDGNWPLFEEHRRQVGAHALPASLRVDYLQHLALARHLLGDVRKSAEAVDEARDLATRFGFGVARLVSRPERGASDGAPILHAMPVGLARVADAVRALREAANIPA